MIFAVTGIWLKRKYVLQGSLILVVTKGHKFICELFYYLFSFNLYYEIVFEFEKKIIMLDK